MIVNLDSITGNFLLNRMSAGIALFSPENFSMLWCNGSFRKQTWFGLAEGGRRARKVSLFDLFPDEDKEAVEQLVKIAVVQGYSYDSEREMRRGKHRTFPAEIKFYKVDANTEHSKAFCFEFVDLSITKLYEDLRERESELRKTQAELVQASKMASLGEMAGGIAHEINNPLAIIRGRSELIERLMRKDVVERETVKKMIANIIKTTDRIATIIRGLKSFAYGGGDTEFLSSTLGTVVDDTLALCREHFKVRGIELRRNEVSDELRVECQPVQISQVLLNLLNNASDAVEELEEKWVGLHVEESEESVRITVSDSGSGVPKALRSKLMDPFFTTKDIGKGTGLGLSISKGIIDSHNGKLYLDETSKNTCFVIELPKKHNPEPKAA